MNFCFLCPPGEYYSPISGGAIATITMQLARELLQRGHRVTVLSSVNEDPSYLVGEVRPVAAPERHQLTAWQRAWSKFLRWFTPWDTAYYNYYLRSFSRQLHAVHPSPDAVMVFNDLVSPRHLRKLCPGSKVLVNLQNEQRSNQTDVRASLSGVHAVLACSEYIRQWTMRYHGLEKDRLFVLNSGVDLSSFYPRQDYLEPRPTLHVLFIGRIDPNKGPDLAADAVGELQREGVPVKFTVAGGLWFYGHGNEMADPFFRTLKGKLDQIQAEYRGHVTRHDVPRLVREHDVVCILSRSQEPFGLVVLEAMASGCAVLASNRGGIPDACGEAGIQVDPDDDSAILAALRRYACEPEFLKEQKKLSVERAARASWKSCVQKLENIVGE